MSVQRAAMTAYKGPKRGHKRSGRRTGLLGDLGAMVRVLEDQLGEVDSRVADGHDPQESSRRVAPAGFVPMSTPRVRRVDVEAVVLPKLEQVKALLRDALADAGYQWTDG